MIKYTVLFVGVVFILGCTEGAQAQSHLQTPADFIGSAPALPRSADESVARTRNGDDSVVVMKKKSLDSVMQAEAAKMSAQVMKDPSMVMPDPSSMNPGDMMSLRSIQTEFSQAIEEAQDSSKQGFDKEAAELKTKVDLLDTEFVHEAAKCPKTQGEATIADPKCTGPLSAAAHTSANAAVNAYLGKAGGTYAKLKEKMGQVVRQTQSRIDSVVTTSKSSYTLFSFNSLKAEMWAAVKSVYEACGDVSATASEESKRQFIAY